ncbi:MAG TPA: efflux RND transporter periplasmic adaptor subunit [Pirellulaceae bacterium]|nr:efflux RND transporter periplasmic adaptor subunit [Pirellulaceae bacterium]
MAAVSVGYAAVHFRPASSAHDDQITAVVVRAQLPIVIVAGGELKSGESVDVQCEIEGSTKIVEMLSEGSDVTKGEVVMRLDPSSVNDRLAQQRIRVTQTTAAAKAATETFKIQQNLGESQVAKAELALTLAELDLKKYIEGEYGVAQNDLKGLIALAEADLREAEDTLQFYRDLVKKGFRTPEQLRAKEQSVQKAEYVLSRDREKLQVLETFTRERQLTELTAKAEESRREVERAKSSNEATMVKAKTDLEVSQATAQLEREQLDKLGKQLAYCEVTAPKDGILVYANTDKARVELGAAAHFKQKLFSIPDMTRMDVEVWIHESVVKKIRPKLKAEVRVEAYPNLVLTGQVRKLGTFYDSTRHWMSGGVKEYAATIGLNQLPNVELKPGMTAQVRIMVEEIQDALIVPIQTVVPYREEYVCYVVGPAGDERRTVTIGENNENFVQILEGVNEGERLALDARGRVTKELEQREASRPVEEEETEELE